MTENGAKTKNEIQKEILDFVKSVGEEFPDAGRRMKNSMQGIERAITLDLSPDLVAIIGIYMGDLMKDKTSRFRDVEDLKMMMRVTDEFISNEKENNGESKKLLGARLLRRCFELDVEDEKVARESTLIIRELKELIGDGSILDPDGMLGIFEGFVMMAEGGKPEDIPNLKEELEKSQKIARILEQKLVLENLSNEKQDIMTEMASINSLFLPTKMTFAKEVIESKLKRLMRNLASYDDVKEKQAIKELLKKTKELIRVENIEIRWSGIRDDCEKYFFANSGGCQGGCQGGSCGTIVPGMFNAG